MGAGADLPPGVADDEAHGSGRRKGRRALAWRRRRRAVGFAWAAFRRSGLGVTGLVMLIAFTLIAVFAPLLADPTGLDPSSATARPFLAPGSAHLLGTDDLGRPVLTLLIWGSRISLLVGLAATAVTMLIGSAVGIAAGYFGGRIDSLLNALSNWFLVIPWIALAAVMAAILGPSILNIILVIGITSWASTARLVRAQTLTVRERPFVERARALGAGNWHLVTRHILPNVFPVIFANTVLTVSLSILSETTLSFLGLGDPRSVSWGTMMGDGFTNGALSAGLWWLLIPAGLCVAAVSLAFTMCGYAMDEIINPKIRER